MNGKHSTDVFVTHAAAVHTHSHKTRRSSFLSSSLSEPGFASVLTLHASFSKEALGLSPAFSPAAVKPLSSLFLPPEPNILLGKGLGCSDATGAPPPCFFFLLSFPPSPSLYAFIKSALTLHEWKLPPLNVRISIGQLLT